MYQRIVPRGRDGRGFVPLVGEGFESVNFTVSNISVRNSPISIVLRGFVETLQTSVHKFERFSSLVISLRLLLWPEQVTFRISVHLRIRIEGDHNRYDGIAELTSKAKAER